MSRHDDMHRTPDEQRALAALTTLPPARASVSARQRTRIAFLSEAPAEAPEPRTKARPRSRFWVPLAAAAVILLAVLGIWQYGSGPSALFRVTDVVVAEGVHGAPTSGLITTAATVSTGPESELELQLGQQFRFRMLPATTIELPRGPRRWNPDELVITVVSGEIYGTTGGEGLLVPLRVVAAEAEALILGTTFAVFQEEDRTCVCLWEGSATVTNRHDGSTTTMQPETKFYVYPDGTVSGALPLDGMERMKLSMMADGGVLPAPEN